MPEIPMPWLTPSDPATASYRGYELGSRVGFQQAAQRFQQMQLARQMQMDEMQNARWEADMGLKAAELAQKHSAQMAYQRAIEGGVDPLDAMIRFGPAMGSQASAEAAAIRAAYQKEKTVPTWKKVDFDGASVLMSSDGKVVNLPNPSRPTAEYESFEDVDAQGNPIRMQRNLTTGKVESFPGQGAGNEWQKTWVTRDQINNLQGQMFRLDQGITESEDIGSIYVSAMNKDAEDRSATDKRAIEIHDQMTQKRDSLMEEIKTLQNELKGGTSRALPPGAPRIRVLSIRPAQTPTEEAATYTDED